MGKRNDEFRRKYNELDKLCRAKYNMFRTKDNKRENLSAIMVFAKSLPQKECETLTNLIYLRNLVEHNDVAEVNYIAIKNLNMFLAIIQGKYSIKSDKDFNLVSYIDHNKKVMRNEIIDLDLDDEDYSPSDIKKVQNELYGFIDKLAKAKNINDAKMIVRQFHNFVDNIDNHPIFVKADLENSKNEAIQDIYDALNEFLNESRNPFKKRRAKEIASRYINQIRSNRNADNVESLSSDACFEIESID